MIIKDAPPEVSSPGLKLTRPEMYYGENVHDPVFVDTAQPEFNYPVRRSQRRELDYDGKGGFPISSLADAHGRRGFARATSTSCSPAIYAPNSRMMIRRNVSARLNALADFLTWDPDPYLVLTDAGRLVWIVDGYMTSRRASLLARDVGLEGVGELQLHPQFREGHRGRLRRHGAFLRIRSRRSAAAGVSESVSRICSSLLPAMPADLRAHVRYPETIFRVQADIYRLFHMRDPDTFYNKSDAWDTAKFTNEQGGHARPLAPTYVVATLPGETKPEFLLMTPFTPRNRDNLIGLMMARCDGEHLGEKVVLLLSKQEIILGPMQVEARINQDQNISKDLTLWNQQGSQVLRGQMLVLPIEHTFLYVEPIYIPGIAGEDAAIEESRAGDGQ